MKVLLSNIALFHSTHNLLVNNLFKVYAQRVLNIFQLLSADSEGNPETAGRFRVETGDREVDEMINPVNSPVHLENPESQTRWYFKYFLGKCKY